MQLGQQRLQRRKAHAAAAQLLWRVQLLRSLPAALRQRLHAQPGDVMDAMRPQGGDCLTTAAGWTPVRGPLARKTRLLLRLRGPLTPLEMHARCWGPEETGRWPAGMSDPFERSAATLGPILAARGPTWGNRLGLLCSSAARRLCSAASSGCWLVSQLSPSSTCTQTETLQLGSRV